MRYALSAALRFGGEVFGTILFWLAERIGISLNSYHNCFWRGSGMLFFVSNALGLSCPAPPGHPRYSGKK